MGIMRMGYFFQHAHFSHQERSYACRYLWAEEEDDAVLAIDS
jgi:hypothetical protein